MKIRQFVKKLAPFVGTGLVLGCAVFSLAKYTPPVFEAFVQEEVKGSVKEEPASEEAEKPAKGSFDLDDGVYEGTGVGYRGDIKVAVSIKDLSINQIEVLSSHDDPAFFNRATKIIDDIVLKQSWEVDVVTGATYSSNGIKKAVENAITGKKDESKAAVGEKKKPKLKKDKDAGKYKYKDGTFRGVGKGFAGNITVDVTIKKGLIKNVKLVDSSDGKEYMDKAWDVVKQIIKQQNTNVDTASGATYSSIGIIDAVRDALKKARIKDDKSEDEDKKPDKSDDDSDEPGEKGKFPYLDGTYNGTGEGYEGEITVALTIKDETIQKIRVVASCDDEPFFTNACALLEKIIKTQDINVDTVSGATFSSRGLLEAVSEAIKAADEATNGKSGEDEPDKPDKPEEPEQPDQPDRPEEPENPEDIMRVYNDGEYTATAVCMPDENWDFDPYYITVTLLIKDDRVIKYPSITADYTDGSNDNYFKWAINGRSKLPGVPAQIIDLANIGNLQQVDVVTYATCSSRSIIDASSEAIEKARIK